VVASGPAAPNKRRVDDLPVTKGSDAAPQLWRRIWEYVTWPAAVATGQVTTMFVS